jgi:hypothetical protein
MNHDYWIFGPCIARAAARAMSSNGRVPSDMEERFRKLSEEELDGMVGRIAIARPPLKRQSHLDPQEI